MSANQRSLYEETHTKSSTIVKERQNTRDGSKVGKATCAVASTSPIGDINWSIR